jgi:CelD/BcsL family acetyltransferase involved in cellulose biosynthesis
VSQNFSLTEVEAYVAPHADTRRGNITSEQDSAGQSRPGAVTVEIATAERLATIEADWRALTMRADVPNIFMHPALVRLAARSYELRMHALLAWQRHAGRERLVGVWTFACRRAPQSILPLTMLTTPPMPNAYLATPVIDRACLEETLSAMLEFIAVESALPKIIALDAMTADCATMHALTRVLAARGSPPFIFRTARRPTLASALDGKQYMEQALSSGSRKKLRQHRRRLGEMGALEFRIINEPGAVRTAFEDFLSIEASGWKGRQGTAIASDPADAAFARDMIGTLVQHGGAAIHVLTLAGRPIGLQVVLRAGRAAFTWKTTYDERLQDYSPGMLLLEDYTAAFLADSEIDYVDSCAFDDTSFMAVWREREAIAHMWIDVQRNPSLAFPALCRAQKTYLGLRATAKSAYRRGFRQHASTKH